MTPELLQQAWAAGRIVPLAGPAAQDQQSLAAALGGAGVAGVLARLQAQWGPGVVLGSGGSSGHRRWCLQPLSHLQASADATGRWLAGLGIDPAACVHLNPLPLHHVSGLLPWLRAWQWGAEQRILEQAWDAGWIVPLAAPAAHDQQALAVALGGTGSAAVLARLQERWGPGVVLGSGGSSGGRRWCLQPLSHLQASAAATGRWLAGLGIDPAACVHLNPLPLHHVSGLLPCLRARQWGAEYRILEPAWLRDPTGLAAAALAAAIPGDAARPAVLSLVPTQLQRLLAAPGGVAWLQRLALIWVGGAPLPAPVALQARQAGLRLAPCYGATETAAMVCALAPERFLAGATGCGQPLDDVQLRLEPGSGAIAVRCGRLSPGWLEAGVLQALSAGEAGQGEAAPGWWRSGDVGRLGPEGLEILGRSDGAIHSGGETVFPELLEQRLLALAQAAGLPLQALLLLAVDDPQWGQRLVALVRPEAGAVWLELLAGLQRLCEPWAPAERPSRWLCCPELAASALGKWQRRRWRAWLDELEAGQRSQSAPTDDNAV